MNPREHLEMSGDIVVVSSGIEMVQASSGERPGRLLNILQGIGQPMTKNDPAHKVPSAEAEEPRCTDVDTRAHICI